MEIIGLYMNEYVIAIMGSLVDSLLFSINEVSYKCFKRVFER